MDICGFVDLWISVGFYILQIVAAGKMFHLNLELVNTILNNITIVTIVSIEQIKE